MEDLVLLVEVNRNSGRGSSSHTASTSHPIAAPPLSNLMSPEEEIECQICRKYGHGALECKNRLNFSYQNIHTPHHLSAMLASANIMGENPWFADTGANNRITPYLNELQDSYAYAGSESIQAANWEGLINWEDIFTRPSQ